MKRYIFFPTFESNWSLDAQYVLCGNPRTAFLNPISNATTFLWEQIEPDPILEPITITPNNTSKSIVVTIPNSITTKILLRVTLNGNTNDYKFVEINPIIADNIKGFSSGTGFNVYNNTLNDPLPLLLAPIPSLGSQVIRYTNNTQQTGIRFLPQIYRQSYTDKIKLFTSDNVLIDELDIYRNTLDFTKLDDRVLFNINTKFNVLKNWVDIKVISQDIIPIQHNINLIYPSFIADEYSLSFNSGTGLTAFTRTPYVVLNQSLNETINNNFNYGSGLVAFTRISFTASIQSVQETVPSYFSSGTGLTAFTRVPYTTNIIG